MPKIKNNSIIGMLLGFFIILAVVTPVFAQSTEEKIQLGVQLAGKRAVLGLPDYIETVYNYLVSVAGVLATVLIMWGGLRWVMAGGDSGKIGEAKKTITAALVGLFLVLGSWVILQTVSPALVALKLKPIEKISVSTLVTNFCADISNEDVRFGEAGIKPSYKKPAEVSFAVNAQDTSCGKEYYAKSPGEAVPQEKKCFGQKCPSDKPICLPKSKDNYECTKGQIGGEVAYTDGAFIDDIEVRVLCKNGDVKKVGDADPKNPEDAAGKYPYIINNLLMNQLSSACGNAAQVFGYFLVVEVHDTIGLGFLVSKTDDDFALIPKEKGCGADSKPLSYKNKKGETVIDPDDIDWETLTKIPETAAYFWSQEELQKARTGAAGLTCNIAVSRANFPARR